jgi:alkaline phosphatase D
LRNSRQIFTDPSSATLATEFVGTSISSTDVLGALPEYGKIVLRENPHIEYFNNERGYVRCEVNRESWRTDYRVVSTVRRPQASVSHQGVVRDRRGAAGPASRLSRPHLARN